MTEFSKADMIRVLRAFPPGPRGPAPAPQTLQPLTIGQPAGFPGPGKPQTDYGAAQEPCYDSPCARGE